MSKPRTEKQIRADIASMVVFGYIPKLKKEVTRFTKESSTRLSTAQAVSEICGKPINVSLGKLRIADPTNELIDKLVQYVRIQENQ